MKIRALFLSAIFLGFCISQNLGPGQATNWRGTIEYEDGIEVIKNPNEPLYGEITFELEENLNLGNETDGNYAFYNVGAIAVDSEENIFVLDGGECRIQKFDKNGIFLQTIGQKGQGPGEFEQPGGLFLDSEDLIYARDSLRRIIHIFGKDGRYKRTIKSPGLSANFGVTREKNILAVHSPRSYTDRRIGIVLLDAEGRIIKEVVSFPFLLPPSIKGHMLVNPYDHRLHLFPSNDGVGIYSHSSRYKIFVLDSAGNLGQRIEVDRPSEPVTKKDKDSQIENYLKKREQYSIGEKLSKSEVKKAYIFPEFKPYFTGLNRDGIGRMYVRMFKLYDPKDRGEKFDVFSTKGQYIYRLNIPFFPNIIKKGHIYNIEFDRDTGYSKINRYKIKNWEQIKK